MNYLAFLMAILFLSFICHVFLFSKRFAPILIRPFIIRNFAANSKTAESSARNVVENYQLLFTSLFCLFPIFLFRILKSYPVDNIYLTHLLLILIVLISIIALCFSINKANVERLGPKMLLFKKKIFAQQENVLRQSNSELTQFKKEKKTSISQRETVIISGKEFEKFLLVVEKFELYDKANSHFNIGGYKIKEKGRTITTSQACFILSLIHI